MGFIAPSIWDDETFVVLSKEQKLVWMYLLTGPESIGIPGLLKLTINGIADGLREPSDIVRTSTQRLIELGRIDVDLGKRLIRVPNAPKYNPPQNPNHVRGWYRKWVQLSDSPLKVAHVASLRAVVDRIQENSARREGAGWRTAWAETFGSIGTHVRSIGTQEQLFGNGSGPKQFPRDKDFDKPSTTDDFGAEGTRDGAESPDWIAEESSQNERERSSTFEGFTEAFGQDRPKTRIPDLSPDQRSEIRDPDPDQSARPPEARSAKVVQMPTSPSLRERARKAWERQEQLRAGVVGLRPLEGTDERLERVEACLARHGDADVEHVLSVYAANAQRDPDAAGWFDGKSNWSPSNFETTLGKPAARAHAGGHFKPNGKESYGDGKSVITRKL